MREQQKIASILSNVDALVEGTEEAIALHERLKRGLLRRLIRPAMAGGLPPGNHGRGWRRCTPSSLGRIVGGGTPVTKHSNCWGGGIPWATPTDVAKLGDICAIIQGQSPSSATCSRDPGAGLPFFQGKAEFGRTYPTPNRWCSEPVKVAIENDILISVRAPVGDVNICSERCCIGRGIMAIRAQEGVDFAYVFYYLRAIQGKIQRLGSGTTFASITGEQLKGVKINVPRLEHQRRIASILSGIDAIIENHHLYQQQLERLKRGLMQKLLTGKIRV